ncbi:hypothetical protein Vafri_12245 [Volvox africanus]|uniref:DEAD-box RNA helicase n=1 Tax=Volvox africanus TaxID=51714 RepID=A0A8J4B973_9CHLO|nr:hypothetical protein Vafri_12245 [Volvox africanus]
MGDFNPDFKFDFSDGAAAAQPAWEFSGAILQARLNGPVHGTSIDHKIAQRLQHQQGAGHKARQEVNGWKGKGAAPRGAAAAANGRKQANGKRRRSEEEEEDESEEEEEAPLPGELDEDEDDDDGDEEEEEEDTDIDGDDEDEDEDEEGEEELAKSRRPKAHATVATGKGKNADKAAAAAAAGRATGRGGGKAGAAALTATESDEEDDDGEEMDEDDGEEMEEDDGEEMEEEEEEAAAPSGKGHVQQRQKQGGRANGSKEAAKRGAFYSETPEGTKFSCSSFADLNISRPLLKAVEALGYKTPTPIQAACIPLALVGRDICGSAVTGSGKTAAFALPFLERLLHRPRGLAATYVLVLTPTRELAVQIHSMIQKLAQFTDITVALIVGGLSLSVQAATLRKLPEVVVATPGRLLDHLRNSQSVGLEDLAVVVLDEADRLLEMGFREEVMEVVRCAPKKRQTMLFSATFNDQVRDLVSLSLKQPVRLAADAARAAPELLTQEIVRLKGPAAAATKEAVCLALCSRSFSSGRTIVFCSTKQRAHRLKILFGLAKLPPAAELHGNMSQTARLESLESFRRGETAFLMATDVAARGLDIQGVEVVVNYDAPSKLETYLHRIGRTARAGAAGVAVTLVEDGDRALLKELTRRVGGGGGSGSGKAGGGVALRQRLVPPQAVAQWQARIENMESDVAAILAEERQEADLRKAEMEANKASNMLEHEDEILARPKRTWFMNERQKKDLRKRSAAVSAGEEVEDDGDGDDGGRGNGTAAPSKKSMLLSKAEKRAARKAEVAKEAKEKEAGKRKTTKDPEAEANKLKARSIKTLARELQQQHGLTSAKAAKMAAQQITGLKAGSKKSKKKSKKQKTGDGGSGDAGSGLFLGDGLNTARPGKLSVNAASSGGEGDAAMKSVGRFGGKLRSQLSRTEVNKLRRGGKGKNAFKSKSRFKRR